MTFKKITQAMKSMFKILYICTAVLSALFIAYKYVPHYTEVPIEDGKELFVETSSEQIVHIESTWDKFIEAVIWKESRGNEKCIGDGGKAVGVLQIHPIMVREANRILKMKGNEEVYTYEDRFDREKSIEIFNVVQNFHNKSHDFDRALQIWNKNHPESYKTQIMNKYNELISI